MEDNIWKDINWGMVAVGILSILVWYSIFTIGFWITVIWLIVVAAIVGLWIRLTGRG
jgi:uncharacterized membrane protein